MMWPYSKPYHAIKFGLKLSEQGRSLNNLPAKRKNLIEHFGYPENFAISVVVFKLVLTVAFLLCATIGLRVLTSFLLRIQPVERCWCIVATVWNCCVSVGVPQ